MNISIMTEIHQKIFKTVTEILKTAMGKTDTNKQKTNAASNIFLLDG